MFDPSSYGPIFAPLLADERLNELGPGRPNSEVYASLAALDLNTAFAPFVIRDHQMAQACLAGLWLYHDYLDESHRIAQNIPSVTGSYWHSLMHRREPDSWNSKYWLDRTGRHPIFPSLCTTAKTLARHRDDSAETRFLREQTHWDPYRFVDLCEACRTGRANAEMLCRQIQLAEWRLLFDYCFHRAIGE